MKLLNLVTIENPVNIIKERKNIGNTDYVNFVNPVKQMSLVIIMMTVILAQIFVIWSECCDTA